MYDKEKEIGGKVKEGAHKLGTAAEQDYDRWADAMFCAVTLGEPRVLFPWPVTCHRLHSSSSVIHQPHVHILVFLTMLCNAL